MSSPWRCLILANLVCMVSTFRQLSTSQGQATRVFVTSHCFGTCLVQVLCPYSNNSSKGSHVQVLFTEVYSMKAVTIVQFAFKIWIRHPEKKKMVNFFKSVVRYLPYYSTLQTTLVYFQILLPVCVYLHCKTVAFIFHFNLTLIRRAGLGRATLKLPRFLFFFFFCP